MKLLLWILVLATLAGLAYSFRSWRRRRAELERLSEARFATFIAQATDPSVAKQRLLFDAAARAGEAGEPALSIQLYARLLARYPDTSFATQARAAVEVQKKNLAKA